MAQARAVPLPWLKPALLVGALAPLALLVFEGARGALGANAVAQVLNRLGLLTLIFLFASLAATPLKVAFGWTWPIRIRRMLGLLAFFYASLHMVTYVGVDQGFDWPVIWADLTKRTFIIVGALAYLSLIPLALTSTDAMVRRLGFARWKQLHRLAYVAGVLAAVHFWMRVKRDEREPLAYATVLTGLFLARIFDAWRRRRKKRTGPSSPAAPRV